MQACHEMSGAALAQLDEHGFAELVAGYRPVVLRGIAAHWPLVAAARRGDTALAEALIGYDRGTATGLMVGPPDIAGRFFYAPAMDGFNFDRASTALTPLLRELVRIAGDADPPALYAGSIPADAVLPGLIADNPLPLPAPGGEPRVWIGNRTRVATHFDVSHNIAFVAGGSRTFTLFPPAAVGDLYVGPLDTTLAGQPTSLVDPTCPDLTRFPRYPRAHAAGLRTTLEPGDAIFIPSLWWHHVEAHAPLNLLINCWWGQKDEPSAFAALIHALLAVRDVADRERAGWAALFDHYVFGDEARHAADHLPAAARGVLGAPSPARTAAITGFLMRALNR